MAKDLSKMIPLKIIYESFDHESIMVPQVVWLSCFHVRPVMDSGLVFPFKVKNSAPGEVHPVESGSAFLPITTTLSLHAMALGCPEA